MVVKLKNHGQENKLKVEGNSCSHLLFNFTFLQNGYGLPCLDSSSELTMNGHQFLVEKIARLSEAPYIEIMGRPREQRIEPLDLKIIKGKLKNMKVVDIPDSAIPGTCKLKSDYFSFRINSESGTPSRVIGRMAGTTFFVLYIDCDGELYKHGR